MLDQSIPPSCPLTKPLVSPVSGLPAPGQAHPKRPLSAAATLTIAKQSLQDAQALWLMTAGLSGETTAIGGLFGGQLVVTGRTITLKSFSDRRGVTLSGKVTFKKNGPPLVFEGAVTVAGAAAAHGVLGLSGASLGGTLGGHTVH
jgi:hypothetical protein